VRGIIGVNEGRRSIRAENPDNHDGWHEHRPDRLHPEIARQVARHLAARLATLSELMQDELGSARQQVIRRQDTWLLWDPVGPHLLLSGSYDQLGGLGRGSADLVHYLGGQPHPDAHLLGVETSDELCVHVHTDARTLRQAEAFIAAGDATAPSLFDTRYYFDAHGRSAKVSHFPSVIADERPSIWGRPVLGSYRLVRSEMLPGDFELAGAALALLEQHLPSADAAPPPTER
jgi:hypothetical protein